MLVWVGTYIAFSIILFMTTLKRLSIGHRTYTNCRETPTAIGCILNNTRIRKRQNTDNGGVKIIK